MNRSGRRAVPVPFAGRGGDVSPARISRTSPPRAWIRPTPSVTWTVCPTACACHALRAPGAKRTTLTRTREGSSPRAMTSYQASPVNVSGGAFTVGWLGSFSIVASLLSGSSSRSSWSG